ncbi:dihydrofolate reductase family protein [Actinocrispum sp. NPDC049592]|uniref:dihydrofolate reductase family protein n=1 Tax=Actinocrispum sp. NPDC049592 TaxID=3154835 RepID=UPI0034218EC3
MGKVVANMSMSLDGFIAEPGDGVGELFDWYGAGPVAYSLPGDHPARHVRVSAVSAEHLRRNVESMGALIAGRRLFDVAQGWGGAHPAGVPVVVLTHKAPEDWPHDDFVFVTDGIESAVAAARKLAGDKHISVASPTVAQQALTAGLLDEISVDLVPVLFGRGIRFFGDLPGHVMLDDPEVVQGTRVTHLTYRVRKTAVPNG